MTAVTIREMVADQDHLAVVFDKRVLAPEGQTALARRENWSVIVRSSSGAERTLLVSSVRNFLSFGLMSMYLSGSVDFGELVLVSNTAASGADAWLAAFDRAVASNRTVSAALTNLRRSPRFMVGASGVTTTALIFSKDMSESHVPGPEAFTISPSQYVVFGQSVIARNQLLVHTRPSLSVDSRWSYNSLASGNFLRTSEFFDPSEIVPQGVQQGAASFSNVRVWANNLVATVAPVSPSSAGSGAEPAPAESASAISLRLVELDGGTWNVVVVFDGSPLRAQTAAPPDNLLVQIGGAGAVVSMVRTTASEAELQLTNAMIPAGSVVNVSYTGAADNARDLETSGGSKILPFALTIRRPADSAAVINRSSVDAYVGYVDILFSSPLDRLSFPGTGPFTVKIDDVVSTISRLSLFGSTARLHVSGISLSTQVVKVSYAPPSSNPIEGQNGARPAGFVDVVAKNRIAGTAVPTQGGGTPARQTMVHTAAAAYVGHVDIVFPSPLDVRNVPATSAFTVKIDDVGTPVTAVAIAETVLRLTVPAAATAGQVFLVSYRPPDSNPIVSRDGAEAVAFTDAQVTNRVGDRTPPGIDSLYISGAHLSLVYEEALDADSTPDASAFTVSVGMGSASIERLYVLGATVGITLDDAVVPGDVVTLTYEVPDSNPVRDTNGNNAEAFADMSVENRTFPVGGAEGLPAGLVAATLTRDKITLLFDEILDRTSVPAPSAFTVTRGFDGAASVVDVSAVEIPRFSGRVELTLPSAITQDTLVTLDYDAPISSQIRGIDGTDILSFSGVVVTNTLLFEVGPDGRSVLTGSLPDGFDENYPCGTTLPFLAGHNPGVWEWARRNWPPCIEYTGGRPRRFNEGGKMRVIPSSAVEYFPRGGVSIEWDPFEEEAGGQYNIYKRRKGIGVFGYIGSSDAPVFLDENITPNLADTPIEGANYLADANPGCALWYQGRVFFSGFARNLRSIVASSPAEGEVIRFDHSTPSTPSDAIVRELGSRRGGGVRHMMASQDMIAMTSGEEQRISGGDDGITPRSLTAIVGSAIGSSHIEPIMAREYILMVSYSRKSIWMVRPTFDAGGFETNELTLLVKDMFRDRRIVDWAWASEASTLFVVMDDGTFFSLLFQPEEEIFAWTHHEIELSTVRSVAVAHGALTGEAVYFAVEPHTVTYSSSIDNFAGDNPQDGGEIVRETTIPELPGRTGFGVSAAGLATRDHRLFAGEWSDSGRLWRRYIPTGGGVAGAIFANLESWHYPAGTGDVALRARPNGWAAEYTERVRVSRARQVSEIQMMRLGDVLEREIEGLGVRALPPPVAPSFPSRAGAAVRWVAGEAIENILVPAASGRPAPTYAVVGALPDGIQFDAETRILSGAPTSAGSGTITIQAGNLAGAVEWSVEFEAAAQQYPSGYWAELVRSSSGTSVVLSSSGDNVWYRTSDGLVLERQSKQVGRTNWVDTALDEFEPGWVGRISGFLNNHVFRFRKTGFPWIPSDDGTPEKFSSLPWDGRGVYRFYEVP